jgi:hypothetical protein
MKSAIDQLKPNEREALAHLYDTEGYKALRRLVEIERLELAKDHVGQRDILEVVDLTGQTKALKKLLGTIRDNFKKVNKES